MATKKITDLTARSSFDGTCNVPVDDASQTWRATGAQMLAYIQAQLGPLLVPTGAVLPFGSSAAAPSGFLACNGSPVSRTTYAALFAVVGTAHGDGSKNADGTSSGFSGTHFNLPDYRGRFLRGQDGGIARDPDRAARTATLTGGATGDNVGSVQAAETRVYTGLTSGNNSADHTHSVLQTGTSGAPGGTGTYPNISVPTETKTQSLFQTGITGGASANHTHTVATGQGGSETRPVNAAVAYIIKT